jgi:hypothetical protein
MKYVASPVKHTYQFLLSILPHSRPIRLTFKHSTEPANRIHENPLPLEQIRDVPQRQVVTTRGVFGKDILELLGHETALVVVGTRVAAVLVLVHVWYVDAKKRVGKPRRQRRIGEVGVDD